MRKLFNQIIPVASAITLLIIISILSSCNKQSESERKYQQLEILFKQKLPSTEDLRQILGPNDDEKKLGKAGDLFNRWGFGTSRWSFNDGHIILIDSTTRDFGLQLCTEDVTVSHENSPGKKIETVHRKYTVLRHIRISRQGSQ
jgi:hypothetical protein